MRTIFTVYSALKAAAGVLRVHIYNTLVLCPAAAVVLLCLAITYVMFLCSDVSCSDMHACIKQADALVPTSVYRN